MIKECARLDRERRVSVDKISSQVLEGVSFLRGNLVL